MGKKRKPMNCLIESYQAAGKPLEKERILNIGLIFEVPSS